MDENSLDLRNIPCPQNTARALIFLEIQDENSVSIFLINDGEPYLNFKSALDFENGLKIISSKQTENYWIVEVLKERD